MLPYSQINTLFLDAGNTLVSIDFDWVQRELADREVQCDVETLRRAEAASRPIISAHLLAAGETTEAGGTFDLYLRCILDRVTPDSFPPARIEKLIDQLEPVLHRPGASLKLWSGLMPGVAEALARLRDVGFDLAVVSNSDGTVEAGLGNVGLRGYLSHVFDSHVVGYEKPDPRIFEHALAETGADPSRTLHVGDVYAADVIGARAAGVHAVLLDPYDDWGRVDCEVAPDLPAVADRLCAAR